MNVANMKLCRFSPIEGKRQLLEAIKQMPYAYIPKHQAGQDTDNSVNCIVFGTEFSANSAVE